MFGGCPKFSTAYDATTAAIGIDPWPWYPPPKLNNRHQEKGMEGTVLPEIDDGTTPVSAAKTLRCSRPGGAFL